MLRPLRPLLALPLLASCSLINAYDDVASSGGGTSVSSGTETTTTSSSSGGGAGDGGAGSTSSSSSGGLGGDGGGGGTPLPELPQLVCIPTTPVEIASTATTSQENFVELFAFRPPGPPKTRILAHRHDPDDQSRLISAHEIDDDDAVAGSSFQYARDVLALGPVGDGAAALYVPTVLADGEPEVHVAVWPHNLASDAQPTSTAAADIEDNSTSIPDGIFFNYGGVRELDIVVQHRHVGNIKASYHRLDSAAPFLTASPPVVVNAETRRSIPRAVMRVGNDVVVATGDGQGSLNFSSTTSQFDPANFNGTFEWTTITPDNTSFLDQSRIDGDHNVAAITFRPVQGEAELRVGRVGGGLVHGLDATALRVAATFNSTTAAVAAQDARFHEDELFVTGVNSSGAFRLLIVHADTTPETSGVVFDGTDFLTLPSGTDGFAASTVVTTSPLDETGGTFQIVFAAKNSTTAGQRLFRAEVVCSASE